MISRQAAKLVSTARSGLSVASSSRISIASRYSSSTAESQSDVKFEINKNGKRLTGAEYLESIKSVISEETVPKAAFDVLLQEFDSVNSESSDWKDKYQRSLAETQNVRNRGNRLVDEAKLFAIQGFCKDLLEVADIMDLAVTSIKEEDLAKADPALKNLHDGIVMTKTVLHKTFAKHGLVSVNPQGEKFDPNLHEAVFQLPKAQMPSVDAGCIGHVAKVGYSLKERPIRAAQVGVVVE
ncbi:unnamed protein product [Auanema sp. JU1783]|nr:unnamed protein product [Auanema sp. JU1783]